MKSRLPEIGKISPEVFDELIYPHLGATNPSILVPPQNGVDVGIVEIGDMAIAMTTDPVFIVPEYGWEKAAWFALHILVSDVVTSGLPPTYLSIDLNLPMSMTEEQLETVWKVIDRECKKLGISVVCGHTARYENCSYPMVGGATVLAVGPKDKFVSPQFIRSGDHLIITKGPAIEASGIFASMFLQKIEETFGKAFCEKAEALFYKMSVVEDALTAVSVGVRDHGVTAMHDATECGIWGGVYELAQAAGLGAELHKDKIVVEPCTLEICRLFEISDPYSAISEGTLIIASRPAFSERIVKALQEKQIPASVVGHFTEREKGMIIIEDGKRREFSHPRVDPFWQAFYQAVKNP